MPEVRYLAAAVAELDEAVAWYEARRPSLGPDFVAEIHRARANIEAYPHGWQPIGHGVRSYRLSRFPYAVIYSVEAVEIVIIALAHLHRMPGYWRDRHS